MDEIWRFNLFRLRLVLLPFLCLLLHPNLDFCWSLNVEGLALLRFREEIVRDPYNVLSNWNSNDREEDPCSWFGVECYDGKVETLNLKDLCLGGTLAPELGSLVHIKSIILRNNSFTGFIPVEFEKLKQLEVLDLGYNNLSGLLSSNLGCNLPLAILLLDNNWFLNSTSPELHELSIISELQLEKSQLSNAAERASCSRRSNSWSVDQVGDISSRRLLQDTPPIGSSIPRVEQNAPASLPAPPQSSSPFLSPSSSSSDSLSPSSSPSPSPSPTSSFLPPAPSIDLVIPNVINGSPPSLSAPVPSLSPSPSLLQKKSSSSRRKWLSLGGIGAAVFVFIFAMGILICRINKVPMVKPWATGLSGQLQKAFVTGVSKLKRSDLEAACEDFSNVIESSLDGNMYKGTLSSGVEIAVTSTTVISSKDWSRHLEAQFRKKIDKLSKVNHKNFVNLLGYCEEEKPFTRMMVFEYSPNGTLFEHLHIKEAEHLQWSARLRVAMGIAYCLDHMHQLNPPAIPRSLNSTAIYLTEDYAAKISDFSFWNGAAPGSMDLHSTEFLDPPTSDKESNIYSFGIILLEMITGRLPYTTENGRLVDWALEYFRMNQPVKYMVDPILRSFEEDKLEKLCEVIMTCIHPDSKQRPTMREVTAQLREITTIAPDGATPRLSPLWWAELEILSTSSN